MMSFLRKLRRLFRVLLLIAQLVLWLMGCGDAAEPAQPQRRIDPVPAVAPACIPEPDRVCVSPGPSIG